MSRATELRKALPRSSTTSCASSAAGSTSPRRSARSCRQAPSPRAAWRRSSISQSGLPVLEVGPGTGVITRAILARGVKPENLYAVEYSPRFRPPSAAASFRASTSSRATPSISTDAWRPARRRCSIASSRACRCSTFPCARARRLSRQPARPHSGGPSGRPAHLWPEIADTARARRLHGRAFRLHHPQHPADPALDLSARREQLTAAGVFILPALRL